MTAILIEHTTATLAAWNKPIVVPPPTKAVDGDLVLCCVAGVAIRTLKVPGGWCHISDAVQGKCGLSLLLRRFSPTMRLSFMVANPVLGVSAVLLVIRGANPTKPIAGTNEEIENSAFPVPMFNAGIPLTYHGAGLRLAFLCPDNFNPVKPHDPNIVLVYNFDNSLEVVENLEKTEQHWGTPGCAATVTIQ